MNRPHFERRPSRVPPTDPKTDPFHESVPATLVADARDTTPKRLAIFGAFLILGVGLFIGIRELGQANQALEDANQALEDAATQRGTLIDTVDRQGRLILALQDALIRQNQALTDAGIEIPVAIPEIPGDLLPGLAGLRGTETPASPPAASGEAPEATSGPVAAPAPAPTSPAAPAPGPATPPPPTPAPTTPAPLLPLGQTVCGLTGVCLQ